MIKKHKSRGRYSSRPMPLGCLYLNNTGTKWVTRDMRFYLKVGDKLKPRLADHYESLGNYGLVVYRYKGKKFKKFPDDVLGPNCIPIVDHGIGAQ